MIECNCLAKKDTLVSFWATRNSRKVDIQQWLATGKDKADKDEDFVETLTEEGQWLVNILSLHYHLIFIGGDAISQLTALPTIKFTMTLKKMLSILILGDVTGQWPLNANSCSSLCTGDSFHQGKTSSG